MSLLLIIGVRVRETNAEISTDPAITMPNSRNNLPVNPCKKMMGKKTAASVIVVDSTAKKISLDPA